MKHVKTLSKTFVVELTEEEIYFLVERLKYADKLYNVAPDPSKPTWQALEKLVGTVNYRVNLY